MFAAGPACIIVGGQLLWDLVKLSGIARARLVRKPLDLAARPFRNFLQLEDLAEYEGTKVLKVSPPRWKTLLFCAALAAQTTILSATFIVHLTVLRNEVFAISFSLVTGCWVRAISLSTH